MAKFLGGRTMEASEGGVSTLGAGAVLVDWVGEQTAELSLGARVEVDLRLLE